VHSIVPVCPDTLAEAKPALCSGHHEPLARRPKNRRRTGPNPWLHRLGRTAARALFLRPYVTIDRRRQRVAVAIRWLWLWKIERIIPFDRVDRIIYRAQGVPSFSPLRYLFLQTTDVVESAFYYISIGIREAPDDKYAREEVALFSVWEQQPRAPDFFDKVAGVRINPYSIGDEASGAIVDRLRDYLGVPIASH